MRTSVSIHLDDDFQERFLSGIKKTCTAIAKTYAPNGDNVIIDRGNYLPHITKDGVTVAKSIFLSDPVENMGSQIVKDICNKTMVESGDGTTSVSILLQSLIEAYRICMQDTNINKREFLNTISDATDFIIKYLESIKLNVTSEEELKSIATISANNDSVIGGLIGSLLHKVGAQGVIDIKESTTGESYFTGITGVKIPSGFASLHFTEMSSGRKIEFENPKIFVTNHKISTLREIKNVTQFCLLENLPLVIFCSDIAPAVLVDLIKNKQENGLQVCVIKIPKYGVDKSTIASDIATITGATLGDKDLDIKLSDFDKIENLGTIENITIQRNYTTLTYEKPTKEFETLITSLKEAKEFAETEVLKEAYSQRLSFLTGGASILYLHANSEAEMTQLRDRIDDAIESTKVAITGGYLYGACKSYVLSADKLDEMIDTCTTPSGKIAIKTLQGALRKMLEILIRTNVGDSEDISHFQEGYTSDLETGYNVLTGELCSLREAKIIEPFSVNKSVIKNAVSGFKVVITTTCGLSIDEDII